MPELTTFGETMLRFSPPRGERLETAVEFDVRTGGAESNVAVVAATLGIDAAWLSKLAANPLGRHVARDLRANGVEVAVVWDDHPDARQGTYYLEPGGAPRGTNVVYDRAGSAVTTATADELDLDRVRTASYFCTSGITPALSETLRSTTAELLGVAADAGTTTVLDVNYRSKLWSPAEAREALGELLPLVDVVCVAERDARSVLGLDGDVDSVAAELRSTNDADLVLVTRGPDGVVAFDGDRVHHQAAVEADTVDPVGTGDGFLGGFLAYRLRGEPLPAALEAAAATAAISRTVQGDWAAISPDEVARVREGAGGLSR